MSLLCHRTMDWQLAPQALSLPLRLVSCTLPLLDGPSFHHADQPAFAFKSRQFRRCTGLHLLLPSPLKSLTVWQHGDCALRGITLDITGPPNGIAGTMRNLLRRLRCMSLLGAARRACRMVSWLYPFHHCAVIVLSKVNQSSTYLLVLQL